MTDPPRPAPEDDDSPETIADMAPNADTVLAPAAQPAQPLHAWSLDDGDDWQPPRMLTTGRITAAAVAVSGAAIAAAAVIGFTHLRDQRSDPPPAAATLVTSNPPPPSPATVTTVIVQPPPVTVTERDVPTLKPSFSPPATASLADRDDRFIGTMKAYGWNVFEPAIFAQHGRNVCTALRQGHDKASAARIVQSVMGVALTDAEVFVRTATEIYPNCP